MQITSCKPRMLGSTWIVAFQVSMDFGDLRFLMPWYNGWLGSTVLTYSIRRNILLNRQLGEYILYCPLSYQVWRLCEKSVNSIAKADHVQTSSILQWTSVVLFSSQLYFQSRTQRSKYSICVISQQVPMDTNFFLYFL